MADGTEVKEAEDKPEEGLAADSLINWLENHEDWWALRVAASFIMAGTSMQMNSDTNRYSPIAAELNAMVAKLSGADVIRVFEELAPHFKSDGEDLIENTAKAIAGGK